VSINAYLHLLLVRLLISSCQFQVGEITLAVLFQSQVFHIVLAEVICEECGMTCSNSVSYKLHKSRHKKKGDSFRPNFKLMKTHALKKKSGQPALKLSPGKPKFIPVPTCIQCDKVFSNR